MRVGIFIIWVLNICVMYGKNIFWCSYFWIESIVYLVSYDICEVFFIYRNYLIWGDYVFLLMFLGFYFFKFGVDVGDYFFIIFIRLVIELELGGGDLWRLYEYVMWYFFGSVSFDCKYIRWDNFFLFFWLYLECFWCSLLLSIFCFIFVCILYVVRMKIIFIVGGEKFFVSGWIVILVGFIVVMLWFVVLDESLLFIFVGELILMMDVEFY